MVIEADSQSEAPDLPFLTVHKDGELLESMCLHGYNNITIGRHTNCHLMVTHPSISRRHAEIQVLYGSGEIMVTDLDSIHGTWINGKQAPPLTPVIAKEGDIIKLGASSRIYSVHWRPNPPQNSTSSEECSENSEMPVDGRDSKEQGQEISDNKLCPGYNSTNFTGMNEQTMDPYFLEEPECARKSPHDKISDVSSSSKGVCNSNQNKVVEFKESLVDSSSTKKNEKKMPRFELEGFDAQGGSMDGYDGPVVNSEMQEAKPLNIQDSKLWLRRSKCNPPPRLVTSNSPSCNVPLHMQDNHDLVNTYEDPVPPMPLSCLINQKPPSAPPLPPAKSQKILSKVNVNELENNANAAYDGMKENVCPSLLCDRESSENVAPYATDRAAEMVEEHVSDKENDSPVFGYDCQLPKVIKNVVKGYASSHSLMANMVASRRPFQPLVLISDGGCKLSSPSIHNVSGEEDSSTQMTRHPSPVGENLDLMLRKLKGMARTEPRRAWHIVADITCFLDSGSFKSLRQLEGLREIRLIIPKIVISELDYRRGIGRSRQKALRWIESCMVKLPSWIHVQSSSENFPAATTPPVSPLSTRLNLGGSCDTMLSPTNGDHVLNCALLFNNTVCSGHVALLTNDVALKIKAMAEGLVCESPSSFCDSLLSPYSNRFLWAVSTAHGHGWTEKPSYTKSVSVLAPRPVSPSLEGEGTLISAVKAMAFKKPTASEGLKRQCTKQAKGLKVALMNPTG